jgi:uncharacterized protein YodC (DUF2158 family)
MNHLFRPGELVRVQGTAGPEMLVEGYDQAGKVLCSFWEGVSRKLAAFPEEILERIPPATAPPP